MFVQIRLAQFQVKPSQNFWTSYIRMKYLFQANVSVNVGFMTDN